MAGMAGPLQVRVASPDFSDWQNIDWSTLDPLMGNASMSPRLPGSVLTPSMGGNEGLYDFGPGFVSFLSSQQFSVDYSNLADIC